MSPSCQAESDGGVYALLIDGTTVLIRPAKPEDEEAVRHMHAQMSPENIYLRFFSASKLSSVREARRVTRPPGADHCALLAWLDDRLVGVASYEPAQQPADEPAEQPGVAEIAFAVTDDMHGRGVATLLLDHLVSIARLRGVRAFTAQTLASNAAMLRVFAAAGLAGKRRVVEGVVETTFPLPVDEANKQLQIYLDSVAMRERQADIASLRHLLNASSIAIVGASRKPTGVGHAILRNILEAGFNGQVLAINPNATSVAGVPSVPSAAGLPQPPDLVVIAVPAASVVAAAQDCGRAGARSLVVITAGIDADTGAELLATCRRFGMRLVGPNCFGIAVPGIGLNATFAGASPPPGTAGLIVQSGGIGIAVLEHLSRLGIGVSSFASVGDKYDVSSNDMLMWWEQDGITKLAVLYVESFGSPRRFAKTARRVGRKFPVLTVIGGRSPAGQLAAGSLAAAATTPTAAEASGAARVGTAAEASGAARVGTAAEASGAARVGTAVAGTSLITQEALFGQAGVIATTSLGELVDAAAMLYSQPLPKGDRIGIVTNAGGAGVLAADACGDNDLKVAALSQPVMRRLRRLLPGGAAVGGPVDTTATVSRRAFKTCLELVAEDDGVDAIMAITVRTALGDLGPALVSATIGKPLVAVMLDQRESVTFLRPGDAVRTRAAPLASAAVPTRAAPLTSAAVPTRAAPLTSAAVPTRAAPLASAAVGERCVPAYLYPESAARALRHATRYGAWRAASPGVIPEVTGVSTAGAREIVDGVLASQRLGDWLAPDQAAELLRCYGIELADTDEIDHGVELLIGVTHEPVFGPVVVLGLGGDLADVLDDKTARLAPLNDVDADAMIRGIRAAPLLLGHVDLAAIADLLHRVSRLADDIAEIAQLTLNPVIARPDGAYPAGARIRLVPAEPQDPFLRRLR